MCAIVHEVNFVTAGMDYSPVAANKRSNADALGCCGRLAIQLRTACLSYRTHLPAPDQGGPSPRARIAQRCSGVQLIRSAHSRLLRNGLQAAPLTRAIVSSTTRSMRLSSSVCDVAAICGSLGSDGIVLSFVFFCVDKGYRGLLI